MIEEPEGMTSDEYLAACAATNEDRERIQEVLQSMTSPGAIDADLDNGSSIVTRWVVVVERMTADGHRALQVTESERLTSWDSIGMLTAAAEMAG